MANGHLTIVHCKCPVCVALQAATAVDNPVRVAWEGQEMEKEEARQIVKMIEIFPEGVVIMRTADKWKIMNAAGMVEQPTLQAAVEAFNKRNPNKPKGE